MLRTVSILSMAAVLAAAGNASAQEQNAADQETEDTAPRSALDVLIVTAQKREEPLQKVPVSVSAFRGETLQNARMDDLTSLKGIVPGMTISESGAGAGIPQFSLRGISIQDVLPSVESGVGITVDGVPIQFQRGAILDTYDLERLEVLRGPQGVLNGRNTTGGTINAFRSRPNPDEGFGGKLRFTGGSYGRNDYEGVVTGAILPGLLAGKVGFTSKHDNGLFKNSVTGNREGDHDYNSFNLALVATPTDRTNFYLSFDLVDDDSDIPPYTPAATAQIFTLALPGYINGGSALCLNPSTAVVCVPLDKKRNTVETTQFPAKFTSDAVTFEASYEADFGRFVSLTGYRDFDETQISDFDATRFGVFRRAGTVMGEQISQELRFESAFDGPFNLVAGAFFMNYSYSESATASLDVAAINPLVPAGFAYLNSLTAYLTEQDNTTYALFFQSDFNITDELTLTVGARQTWDEKDTHYIGYDFIPGIARDLDTLGALLGDVRGSAKFHKFTPKVSLKYQITPEFLAYASYSRGYNAGGFSGRPGDLAIAVQAYQPETMDAYEIGFKSEFFGNRLRLNVSAFENKLKDKQENVLTIGGTSSVTATLNIASATYKGVEVELAAVPVTGWTITSSFGYLDAKYDEFMADLGQGFVDASILNLRRTPKYTAGVVSDYVVSVGPGDLGLNAAVYHTSSYETDFLNDPRAHIPNVTRVDLGMRYSFPVMDGVELELSGFVKNVTDNTTYDGYVSGDAVGTFIEWASPNPGRLWGGSVAVHF